MMLQSLKWKISCLTALAAAILASADARAGLLVSYWLPNAAGPPGIYHRDEDTGAAKAFPNDPATSFIPLTNAVGVTVGPNGLLYVAASSETSSAANTIYTYDPLAADVVASQSDFLASVTDPNERPGIAHGMIFDREGNLYVSNWSDGTIKKYGPSGAYLGVHASQLGPVSSMAFLSDGSGRMVAAAGDAHVLIEPDGTFATFSQSTPTKSSLAAFQGGAAAIDRDGNVLVSNSAGFGTAGIEAEAVARFDPSGSFLHDVVPSDAGNTAGGVARIFGVLEGPQGDVFMASLQAGSVNWVGRFDSRGLPSTTGRPSFAAADSRDFDTGSNAMGRQIRYLWLWDEGNPVLFGHSDPVTKQYVDAVPEPSSVVLVAIGALGAVIVRRRLATARRRSA